jgi:hypothetical protein
MDKNERMERTGKRMKERDERPERKDGQFKRTGENDRIKSTERKDREGKGRPVETMEEHDRMKERNEKR